MRRRPNSLVVPVLLAALAMLAAACGGGDDETSADRTGTSVRITVEDDAGTDDPASTTTEADASSSTTNGEGTDGDPSAGDGTGGEDDDDGGDPTTSQTQAADDAAAWPANSYRLVEVASVAFPTTLASRAGTDDLWVAEREGRVRQLRRSGDGFDLAPEPTLDIASLVGTGGEGGLLGLTFSGDGQLLYVSYTNNDGDSVIAEYPMAGDEADAGAARILLTVEQPFSNHNGGQVERGPDGLLYFGLGDGGSGGDPLNAGQDTTTLLGSILRLDPANPGGEAAYGVPADNPFADGVGGRPEIWLYGVRNPWRFSFDRARGDLWIGDVGQNTREEITVLRADGGPPGRGANLGWRLMEGDRSFEGGSPPPGHVAPIHTYGRDGGACSVTGGYVYRGEGIPALDGVYLFGDYCTGEIVGLQTLADGSLLVGDVVTDRGVGQIVSFGEDADGEVYVLGSGGSVSRLEAG